MKFYLLTMGHYYYPQSGDKDWIETFSSREEAIDSFTVITRERGTFDPNEPEIQYLHINTNKTYDWYNIIDLREWML